MTAQAAPPDRHAVITGCSGYIGGTLAAWLSGNGYAVTGLARHRPAALPEGVRYLPWEMGDPVPENAWRGNDTVFHIAHDWTADTPDPRQSINVRGASQVIASARAHRAQRIVVASSQLANPAAPGFYGRVKYEIEQLLSGPDEIPVRMGFVYGGTWGGPAGRLAAILRRIPIVPTPAGSATVRPVHIDDVCAALDEIATSGWPNGTPPFIAGPEQIPLGAFVKLIGKYRVRARRLYVPTIGA